MPFKPSRLLACWNPSDDYAQINRIGYSVDVVILDAERFVPQSRVRLFVIGSLHADKPSELRETAGFYQSAIRPRALADFIFGHPEINWSIRDLPEPPKRTKNLSDIVEDLPEDSDFWWSRERTDYLVAQMSERHSATLEEMKRAKTLSNGALSIKRTAPLPFSS
ncbi:MAG: DNA cytosine methyltransferase [Opitutales bacterium]